MILLDIAFWLLSICALILVAGCDRVLRDEVDKLIKRTKGHARFNDIITPYKSLIDRRSLTSVTFGKASQHIILASWIGYFFLPIWTVSALTSIAIIFTLYVLSHTGCIVQINNLYDDAIKLESLL